MFIAYLTIFLISGAVAIDEGFVILSSDLVRSILDRMNSTLLCHPFGGQNIGIWLNGYPGLQAFGDNKRLFHLNFDSKYVAAKRPEICKTALGIHRSYPEEMKIYWDVYQKEPKNKSYIVPPITFPCHIALGLNYRVFSGDWFAEPKLCKDNPIWKGTFEGRQFERLGWGNAHIVVAFLICVLVVAFVIFNFSPRPYWRIFCQKISSINIHLVLDYFKAYIRSKR